MPLDIMAIVLLAALLHASWNALVRASSRKFNDTVLIVLGAGVWTALLLPLVPIPAVESWPYLAASVLIHVVYFALVAFSYRSGELSFAYPLMRGFAPALSAVGAALLINESPSLGGWAGVLLISCGVLVLAGDAWRSGTFHAASAVFALINAGVIAVYTLIDGQGARLSGHAFSYTGWMFLLTAPLLFAVSAAVQGREVLRHLQQGWRKGLLGGGLYFGIVRPGALGHDARAHRACRGTAGNFGDFCSDACGLFPERADNPAQVRIDIYSKCRRCCNKGFLGIRG